MSNVAISVESLSKSYRIAHQANGARYKTLREDLMQMPKRILSRFQRFSSPLSSSETFWALKDISFEIKQGEVVGIIGRNGAGKSTLLKILSRITEPTSGQAKIYGRIGSLLEVGTGFHSELTGRENIFLNGAILGMSRAEIRSKFDEIVTFAQIDKFLDTPVKRYSSGMYVRLAFAVAAHLDSEILLVDEVLAVGDAEFQKKCLGKMSEVARGGRTVLFVSHQLNAVRAICDRCVILLQGTFTAEGPPDEIIAEYLNEDKTQTEWKSKTKAFDNPYFTPTKFAVVDQNRQTLTREARADEQLGILIEGETTIIDPALVVGFSVFQTGGPLLFWSLQTDTIPQEWPRLQKGKNSLVTWLPSHFLNEGSYRIEMIVSLHHRVWYCQPEVSAPIISCRIQGGLSRSPHWLTARPGLLAPILSAQNLATE